MTTNNTRLAYVEAISSVVLNALLFAVKIWVGIVTRSVAIVADAWHTLSDSFTSLVVLVGARASTAPADREHPFGHGRAELIASIVIGVLLAVVGVNFFVESVRKLLNRETAEFSTAAVVVFCVSAVLKEILARYSFWAAKKTGMRSLRADGWHHRSDAIASALIVVGIVVGGFLWWLDAVLGIAVALLILYAALETMRESVSPILGERADSGLMATLARLADEVMPGNAELHHVHVHRYGAHTEITLHVTTDGDRTLFAVNRDSNALEAAIRRETGAEVTIHCEPRGISALSHPEQTSP